MTARGRSRLNAERRAQDRPEAKIIPPVHADEAGQPRHLPVPNFGGFYAEPLAEHCFVALPGQELRAMALVELGGADEPTPTK